ncbi:threonine--tRNA ligase, partial [Candidatus Saccharibacteria bacterium SW_7_54_9]
MSGKEKNEDQLHAMRHSLAHIMAAAIQKLWPEAKFGVGPVTDTGFYYDVDLGETTLTPEDLPKIEAEMGKIIEADLPLEQFDLPIAEAIEREKQAGQDYKVALLQDLQNKGTTAAEEVEPSSLGVDEENEEQGPESVSYYQLGDFVDLCRGPHVKSTGQVGAFRLHQLAGAYWRGDENNPMLQRIYGVAFPTQEEVDEYFELLEEARERDHRKIGQELGLFTFSDLVGAGLPLFTPKGTALREILGQYSQQLREARGFQRVWIPHAAKTDLYQTSGHWDKFGDELFLVTSQATDDQLVLKPMNCPHHAQIYASQQRSYRDLPVKYMENTTVYRDEKSGELHGLSRVRSITQDDCHVFAREDQIEQSVTELVEAGKQLNHQLDMELKLQLSFRDDSDDYLGDATLWERAQADLERIASDQNIEYYTQDGEASFYGPKLDFMAVDVLGREWELATVQLDFVQPGRFELEYVDETGERQTPVMMHAALLGSL